MNSNEAYKYNSYTNIKAIIDFLEYNGYNEDAIKIPEVWTLSYLVNLYTKQNNLETITLNGVRYVFVSDSLIKNNLKFLPGSRQLKAYLKKLEDLNFITRETVNRSKRFVCVNQEFLKYWKVENWTMNAVYYLMKHKPEFYKSIKRQYLPILSEKYEKYINNFNNNFELNGEEYDVKLIGNKLRAYLETISKNPKKP